MSSYIEITFLTNYLISIFAYYFSAYFSLSKAKPKFFYILIGIEHFIHICSDNLIFFGLYEVSMYTYLFYRNPKKGIMFICIKYLCFFTLFKFMNGSFHLSHYYVNANKNMLGIWILLLLFIILLKNKWNAYLLVSDFIYDVYFYTNRPFHILGFLDTGNQLKVNEIPVIFVDCVFKDRFMNLPSQQIDVYTIHSIKKRNVYLCEVKIKGYKKQSYYICCDEHICLEFNCKCILNFDS